MKALNKLKRAVILCMAAAMGVMMLQGCGSVSEEEMLASMKEFKTADESISIYLDEDWTVEDVGMDNWLCAGNDSGSEAFIVMQFPFNSTEIAVSGFEELTSLVEENYGFSGEKAEEAEIPGMKNIVTYEGEITISGVTCDGYVVYGETDYAYYAFLFAADHMNDGFRQKVKLSCGKFVETAREAENNTAAEMTDTIRWINATYAVLTELNGWDYNIFAGLPANEESKAIEIDALEEWWDVTDRTTADETLNWALTEGHRTAFASEMQQLADGGLNEVAAEERVDFLLANYEMDSATAQFYAEMYAMYEQYGATAIDGWDYCRAMNLLSFYYLAGYYTEQEALDKSLEIGQTIQSMFDSWDDLIESYMRGYEYWAEESANERRDIYEDLKGRNDNPYAVDFKMNLEKTW